MLPEVYGSAALVLKETEAKKYDVPIGNSKFTDDIWDLSNIIDNKTISQSRKEINFSYIKNSEMREIVKLYAFYCLKNVTPITVRAKINSALPPFFDYCEKIGLESFNNVNLTIFVEYADYLRNERHYRENAGYTATYTVEELMKIGYRKGWLTKNIVFADINSRTLWNRSNHPPQQTEHLPDFVLDQIVRHANNDERDPVTRSVILVQSQTGLRINEVLALEEGCILKDSYGYYLKTRITKTAGEDPIEHHVYLNPVALEALRQLQEDTKELREEIGSKSLCLYKDRGKIIRQMTGNNFQTNRVPAFVKRWNIVGLDGNPYYFHTHQFRATFAHKVIQSGFSLDYIRQQFGHVSLEMTLHYLGLSTEEVKEAYAKMLFTPAANIAGKKAPDIKEKCGKLFRGKTEEEIEGVIKDLSKNLSFNPLPHGICMYNVQQGACHNGDGCFFYNCPNFATSVEFLPVFKKELEQLNTEMERCKEKGMDREWQRHFVYYSALKPIVEELEGSSSEK